MVREQRQLGHDARQHDLGGRGAEREEQLVLDVHDELPQVHPREDLDDDAEDHDEQGSREIAAADQLRETAQGADAVLADDVGHRPEGADRRKSHDPADDGEEQMAEVVDDFEDDGRTLLAELGQRQSEQDGEEQHLKQVVLGERLEHRFRDDVEQKVDGVRQFLVLGFLRQRVGAARQFVGIDVEPCPRFDDVADHQPEEQREGGDDFEVDQRFPADPADRLEVANVCDAQHDGAEDDRRDQHLDELYEAVGERFEIGADLRVQPADQDSGDDRDEQLHEKRRVPRWLVRQPDHLALGGFHRGRHRAKVLIRHHRAISAMFL